MTPGGLMQAGRKQNSFLACSFLFAVFFCAVIPLPGYTETLEQIARIMSASAGGTGNKSILIWRDNFRYRKPYNYSTPFADLLSTRMSKAFMDLGARVITDPPQDLEAPFFLLSGEYFLDGDKQPWVTFTLREDLRNREGRVITDSPRKLDEKWRADMIRPALASALDALLADWAKKLKREGLETRPVRLAVVLPDRSGELPVKLGGKIYQDLCRKLKEKKFRRIKKDSRAGQVAAATYAFTADSREVILRLRLKGAGDRVFSEKRFPRKSLAGELLLPEIIGPRKICIQQDPACPVSRRNGRSIQKGIHHFIEDTIAEYGVIKKGTIDEQCPAPGEPSPYHLQIWACFDSHEQPASRFAGQSWYTQRLRLSIRDHRGNPLTEISGDARGLGPAGKEVSILLMDEHWWQNWRKEALLPFLGQITRLDLYKL